MSCPRPRRLLSSAIVLRFGGSGLRTRHDSVFVDRHTIYIHSSHLPRPSLARAQMIYGPLAQVGGSRLRAPHAACYTAVNGRAVCDAAAVHLCTTVCVGAAGSGPADRCRTSDVPSRTPRRAHAHSTCSRVRNARTQRSVVQRIHAVSRAVHEPSRISLRHSAAQIASALQPTASRTVCPRAGRGQRSAAQLMLASSATSPHLPRIPASQLIRLAAAP